MYFRNIKPLLILLALAAITIFITNFPFPRLDTAKIKYSAGIPSVQAAQTGTQVLYTPENVPELKEILSPDQEIRLKAGRKLVERVDVEQALEILEHSSLPHTGEGHLVVHQIGFYAYQKYKMDAILKCKDYFLFACYHGAIIEAASDQGFEAIGQMADKCKESSLRYFQCAHAAGHAILAIWNYDLPNALKTCDETFEKETQFPDALSSCHNGAFMENLFGVHDWGKDKVAPKRDWLSEDPYFPCNAFGDKYQKGCWLNQAARIYQMNQGDILKTAQICQAAGNNQYVTWCMDNLARQIHPLTAGDTSKVFSMCQMLGNWVDNCITVNAGSYYSVGDPKSAIEICKRISPNGKKDCYQNIIGQIMSDMGGKVTKLGYCTSLEEPFKTDCLTKV